MEAPTLIHEHVKRDDKRSRWVAAGHTHTDNTLPLLHIAIYTSDMGLDCFICYSCSYGMIVGGRDCSPGYIRDMAAVHDIRYHRSECTIEDERGSYEQICRRIQRYYTYETHKERTEIIGQTTIFETQTG